MAVIITELINSASRFFLIFVKSQFLLINSRSGAVSSKAFSFFSPNNPNENLFKDFTSNNLYHIPIDSYLIISVYSPLVIQDPVPQGIIEKTKLTWTGISSNELRLLALEKKPPKPSFAVSLEQQRITKTYIIIIIILIILTIIVMNKKTNKKIEKFVINHSEIKPAKINDIHKLENEEIEIK